MYIQLAVYKSCCPAPQRGALTGGTKINNVPRGKIKRNICWHGMAWQGMARHGKAWQGMARHGKAWHGMAWHGMAALLHCWRRPLAACLFFRAVEGDGLADLLADLLLQLVLAVGSHGEAYRESGS